jgi:hypothetical protein
MAKTRDNYQITGSTVEELKRSLNFMLQRFADRMDKIEGIRGTASIESDLEMNANRVREIGSGSADDDAARIGDLLDEPPTFNGVTLTGDLEANNADILVYDEGGNLIHSLE